VTGAFGGMLLWGKSTVSMGPFQVLLSARFGRGDTVISLPPFGHLSADTHAAPLRFTASLQGVRLNQLAEAVRQRGIDGLVDLVETDALKQVVPFALRLLGVAMAGALILALLVYRARRRPVAIALLGALIAVGGSETVAWRTYRPDALLTPSYSGSLALAPKLIGPAQTAIDKIDDLRAELSRVLSGAVRVYSSIRTFPQSGTDEIRVLHVSDIHLSPLGVSFAKEVADAFDVDFVLDTGDLTSFGTNVENQLILAGVASFHQPYVFVRGNHDSMALQDDMARIPGVVVLDGRARRVDGLTVYGLGDPVFTPNKQAAGDDAQIAERVRAVGPRILDDVSRMRAPPAIVAVHDDRMAEAVAGHVPLVVSGHFHVPGARVMDGTLYLRVGSTGGAGANVFTHVGGVPLSAEVLYFSRTSPPSLIAYDLIEQSPESGSLTVRRHLVSEDFGALVPTPPSPSPVESPSPSSSPPLSPTGSASL
jgi:predicted phosphodiesterase